jgi:hypothetical protein
MQRKQQVGECWVCVIFFACVCVGMSDTTTASLDDLGGRPGGGAGMPPLGYATDVRGSAPNFFLGGFCYF